MKKRPTHLVLLLALLCLPWLLPAQPNFQFRYGSPYRDFGRRVIVTADGGYLMVGETSGFGSSENGMAIKLRPNGTLEWARDYRGINSDRIYDLLELPTGEFAMCGFTESFGVGHGYLMQTTSQGVPIWCRAFGQLSGGEFFYRMVSDGAGGFYVAGPGSTSDDVEVNHLGPTGNLIWARRVSSRIGDIDLLRHSNGNVVLGYNYGNNGPFAIYVFSATGTPVWSQLYTTQPDWSGLMNLKLMEDAAHNLVVGFSAGNNNTVGGNYDCFLVKLDPSSGNVGSVYSYGGPYIDELEDLDPLPDGRILISGTTNSAGNGDFDAFMMMIGADDQVAWAKAYGKEWAEEGNHASITPNGIVLAGVSYSTGSLWDSCKFYLLGTDSTGEVDCNAFTFQPLRNSHTISGGTIPASTLFAYELDDAITWPSQTRHLYEFSFCGPVANTPQQPDAIWQLSPNPGTDVAQLNGANLGSPAKLEVYDLHGRRMHAITVGAGQTLIERGGLPAGLYHYKITAEGQPMHILRMLWL